MKTLALVLPLLAAGTAWAGLGSHAQRAQEQQQQIQKAAPKPVIRQAEVKPAASIEYKEIMKGVTQAELWGNPKAMHGALTKFAAGTKFALHTHSVPVAMIIVSGVIVHGNEAGTETKLGPGSYLQIPSGVKHTTACEAGADCVFYQEMPGAFDMKLEDHP